MRIRTANKRRRTKLLYAAQEQARDEFYKRCNRLDRNGHLDRLKRSGYVRRQLREMMRRPHAL